MVKVDFIYPYYYNSPVGPVGTMRRIINSKEFFRDKGYDVNVYLSDYIKGYDINRAVKKNDCCHSSCQSVNIFKGMTLRSNIKRFLKKYTVTAELFMFWKIRCDKKLLKKYLELNTNSDIIIFGDDELCYSYLKDYKSNKAKVILFQHSDGMNQSMVLKSYPKLSKYGVFRMMNKHFNFLLSNVDVFVFIAKIGQRNFLELNSHFPHQKTYFFHNGIDNKPCYEKKEKNKRIQLCCAGTVSRRKGQYIIIEALSRLPKELRDKFLLNIIGEGNDLNQLQKKVSEYSLQNNVIFMGSIPNERIHSILCEQDVFILMSNNEGLPIAIIEAMRAGLPIISTNVAGIPELLVNNNGCLIEPNIEQLYDILFHFDDYDWHRMGQASRNLFEQEFTFEQMLNNYINLFEYCL